MTVKTPSEALQPEKGTPPPRRSRAARSQVIVFLNFAMSAVVFLTLAAGIATWLGRKEFVGAGPWATDTTFEVKPNSGVAEIANQLERRGLISDSRIFRLGVRAFGKEKQLKAGEYEIKAKASMQDIMNVIASGKAVLYSFTIPEGWTVDQALARIGSDEILTGDLPPVKPAEGSLIAETQRFGRGTTRQAILAKMAADQKALVETIWARRVEGLPVKDINEFVTLASIVEKETGKADERPHVASVFINRLNKGMRLQSDPTIIYGLFGGLGKPADRPIYQSDIDRVTPYNTYAIDGLPPTPIANPGRAALEAVANPSKTDDLFFVADGTGGHVFAATLEEHEANVAKWRKIEAEAAKTGGEAAPKVQ
ncbi:MAG: endolytic transglycosylase MltG [Rhizobiaceae bacterium]